MEKIVLIDGNSLINRAFYAMPLLTTKDGIFTNAVYGFMNMFFKMYSDIKPNCVAVAFDMKAPTFRHKIFSQYKGTRKPMPQELRPQISLLKDVLKLMGVKTIEQEGIEADDIIGTLAKNSKAKVIIFTGDKDALQLVDENIDVHFTKRGLTDVEIYTSDNFKEKTGIEPWQIIQLKALMGDSSDNIPGIAGVGEKTAKALIEQYSDIDGIYQNIDELKGKLKEKVETNKQTCYLSKELATICTDCKVDTDVENMRFAMPLPLCVRDEFLRLEFKSLIGRQELFSTDNRDGVQPKIQQNSSIQIVKIESLDNFVMPSAQTVSVVLDNYTVCYSDGQTEYKIPVKQMLLDEGFNLSQAINYLSPLFTSDKKLIVYSKKDLMHLLAETIGVTLTARTEDLSILKYLVDFSGGAQTLSAVVNDYGKQTETIATSQLEIFNELYKKLIEEDMEKLYLDLELPLVDVLFDMEVCGFKVDYDSLEETGKRYSEILSQLEKEIRQLVDEPSLNVNSPKQLGEIIFAKLKLAKGKKTKTGYSTSAEVLESLVDTHPVIQKILDYRKIQKLSSTYVEGLKNLVDKRTGLVKTSFNQTVTSTGRLSSKEPNLQNIPVREEEGRMLRKFFVPSREDGVIIGADYSQIELRLLADFADCQPLIDAFNHGVDIHSATAKKVFKASEVTKPMRNSAKAVNFGIIYGISEYGLAKNLKISAREAKNYIDAYFNEYPEVKEYMQKNVDSAREKGYAITLLGRRRVIREISSANYNLRSFGERAAMNMPLQGSSADIIKLAMLGVHKRLKKEKLQSKLILQVHDELIIDALASEKERVKKILVEEMENAVNLKVKLTVEVEEGKTWFDAK